MRTENPFAHVDAQAHDRMNPHRIRTARLAFRCLLPEQCGVVRTGQNRASRARVLVKKWFAMLIIFSRGPNEPERKFEYSD
jgi:hypothetical protein